MQCMRAAQLGACECWPTAAVGVHHAGRGDRPCCRPAAGTAWGRCTAPLPRGCTARGEQREAAAAARRRHTHCNHATALHKSLWCRDACTWQHQVGPRQCLPQYTRSLTARCLQYPEGDVRATAICVHTLASMRVCVHACVQVFVFVCGCVRVSRVVSAVVDCKRELSTQHHPAEQVLWAGLHSEGVQCSVCSRRYGHQRASMRRRGMR